MSTVKASANRPTLERQYNYSRTNLLLVVIFTAINLVLLVTQGNTYFLFSASIPYILIDFAMAFCGMYPAEYYGEEFANMAFFDSWVFVVCAIIAVIVIALYLISWLFSKNNKSGWLIFALVFFAIDTVCMFALTGIALENIVDIIFHAWVIVSLSGGIVTGSKLKKLPEDEVPVPEVEQVEQDTIHIPNSAIIRAADTNIKSRTLLTSSVFGHTVTYRRVKRVNELVIDGNVYAEMEALVEMPHSLAAQIDGHHIEVGYDGYNSYIQVDNNVVAKKLRLL